MRLSNSAIFLVIAITVVAGLHGCKWWNGGTSTSPAAIPEPKSRIPYPTKEPDRFSAVVLIRTGEFERMTAIAKAGNNLSVEFEPGSERSLRLLRTDKTYVISNGKQIYAEQVPAGSFQGEEFVAELTTRMLHRHERAEYESLGTENGLARYRVRVNGSTTSENIVYVDEKLGMPVITEYFAVNGDARELLYRMEFRDLSLEVDGSSFEIPAGHRKVPVEEFYRIVRSIEEQ